MKKRFGNNITIKGNTFPSSIYGIPIRLATSASNLVGYANIKGYAPRAKRDEILIFPNSFKKGKDYLFKIILHEFSHFIYHRYIKKEYFEKIKKDDLNITLLEYWINISLLIKGYISNYAKTQPAEDFAELIGFGYYIENNIKLPNNIIFSNDVKFKYIIAKKIFSYGLKKYLKNEK